jgi:hypothetical protein
MNYRQRKRQRKQERLPCNIVLKINNSILCNAFDIGEGGMYVLTDQSFKPGIVIKISLLYGNNKIEIRSKVKYCHEGIGIGIMFIDLDNELKAKIKKFVNNIKQLA